MLRSTIIILAIAAVCVFAEDGKKMDHFPDTYDYIDVGEMLANDKLRNQYYDCFMDKGPCVTADAKFFKDFLPETIATKCGRCTERQKSMFEEITVWYNDNDPPAWTTLMAKLLEDAKRERAAGKW